MTPGSLAPLLRPASIAVIGASRQPGTIGHMIVANLVRGGFTGPVYPVNPRATSICSVPAFPTISDVPAAVDVAVISVPKQLVYGVAAEAIERGVPGLVVISAGFREVGGEGLERERQLTELVRSSGVRMIGPNCMGVLNADPAVSMNATFAPFLPPFGPMAFMSQSGAMGMSVLDYARELGIGLSQFVSVGNKPDVSGNDLLLAWEDDPAVRVILMYVENFGNPRRFLEIASRITKRKPIIVVKSGRSLAGARAASSHTGALAASDVAVDALLTQAGVLRAETVEELFDLAMGFAAQTAPRSRRVAIVTNAGGPGIIAADALEPVGLQIPEFAPETVERLRPLFPEEASIHNPLDMIASASPDNYRAALSTLLQDPQVDSAIALYVPIPPNSPAQVAEAMAAAALETPAKPVFAVVMGHQGLPQGRAELHEAGVPAYLFPESAARALAARVRHREWQERPLPEFETFPADRKTAKGIIEQARREGRSRLSESAALDLLACYGIPVARARLVRSADEAVAVATEAGFPVVLKVVAPSIIHKTEADGVQVDLRRPDDVREAWRRIHAGAERVAPGAAVEGAVVQPMLKGGRELIVGMKRDAGFGPLVMFGLGGVLVEVLRDVTFRIAPFGRIDAHDMIRDIQGVRLLDGVRGAPPVNQTAIEDVLLRVAQLALDFPEIEELDVNPLLATESGVVAVDGRALLIDD
ncbi:MAG TPA: acetate--CoA ligase family protein [Gemmatimonadales bacterium]|nr:acetate--CoA ligase family protein [Gemmatimonadales bacterium]